jgi:Leucine-rich repeat (LRR) protein
VCSIYSRHAFAQSCLCHKLHNLKIPNNRRLRFANVDPLMDYIAIRCILEAVGFLPPEAGGKLLLVDVAFRSAIRECQPVLDLSLCRRAKTFNQISLLVNARSFRIIGLHANIPQESELSDILRRTSNLRSLKLTKGSDTSALTCLHLMCPLLTKLHVLARPAHIDALAHCTALQDLNLSQTAVANTSALGECIALETIDLSTTEVADISWVARCTALRNLRLDRTKVVDILALAMCTALQKVSLTDTKITSISALAGCITLKQFNVCFTLIVDVSALVGCSALQQLSLEATRVADITSLAGHATLHKLCLGDANVTDISALASCTTLKELDLGYLEHLTDISSLSGCRTLQILVLEFTGVADISVLAGCTMLRNLSLKHTPVTDISPLVQLSTLHALDLRETQLLDGELVNSQSLVTRLLLLTRCIIYKPGDVLNRCSSEEDCVGTPWDRLVQHDNTVSGEVGDVYCESCWKDFLKSYRQLAGTYQDTDTPFE